VVIIVIAAVAMYAGLWLVRGHQFEGDFSEGSFMTGSDLLSYLPVFDNWVRNGKSSPLALGAYTLAGPFELLGVRSRERAFEYDEIVLAPGIWSNFYTAFRGLIDDFSFPGSLILFFIAGMVVGNVYTRVSCGEIRSLWILAACYVYVLWSPIVSAFNYNSVLLALLVIAIVTRKNGSKALCLARVGVVPV
jgi:oligosaccharide repeat unit polymerase